LLRYDEKWLAATCIGQTPCHPISQSEVLPVVNPKAVSRSGHGFTLVELLVVIAIIAVLVALLVPAVQAARESARTAQCANNIRQFTLGVLQYTETEGFFPPGRAGGLSWVVHVLPYVEQQALFDEFTFGNQQAFYATANQVARTRPLSLMCCPSRRSPTRPSQENQAGITGASGDYAGNAGSGIAPARDGVIIEHRVGGVGDQLGVVRPAAILDGLNNTLLIGEKHVRRAFLSPPLDASPYNGAEVEFSARFAGQAWPLAAGDEQVSLFGSWHPGGVPFSMCDGSVRTIVTSIDNDTLELLAARNDRRPVPAF
jgi:prepilin-type N-terminal cleavage/methylation domain-containing protein/prepilin-type processing-associated H-X9-DG protein